MTSDHVPAARVILITRVAAGLRLSRREEMRKTAEIVILRHQLSLLQRLQPRRPKLDWADRAMLAERPWTTQQSRASSFSARRQRADDEEPPVAFVTAAPARWTLLGR
jgi:hypothetical protein